MPLWAKVDVEMPTDAKLLGQPVTTRHLWTCLICLAKRQDDAGAIRGYDCSLLAGSFNLPRGAVAKALTHFQAVKMVELDADGTIRLVNFVARQGPEDTTNERSRRYYDSHRETIREKRKVSQKQSHTSLTDVSRETVSLEQSRVEQSRGRVEQSRAVRTKATAKDTQGAEAPAPTNAVWQAYSTAIENRYGVAPSDGAPARGKIMQFLRCVPKEEAPLIAEHYVRHNGALYVNAKHPLELLVRDYQKFRTEWINGQPVTATDARNLERTDSNLRGWEKQLVPEGKV
jgi:hypothetical protein